jgi:hypothetical protein
MFIPQADVKQRPGQSVVKQTVSLLEAANTQLSGDERHRKLTVCVTV